MTTWAKGKGRMKGQGSSRGFDIEVPFAFEPSPFAKLLNAQTGHHQLQAFAH